MTGLCDRTSNLTIESPALTRGSGVANYQDHASYRFIIVYRREPREIPTAESRWRGWLIPVPDAAAPSGEAPRMGFQDLDEVPGLIKSWVENGSAMTDVADREGDASL